MKSSNTKVSNAIIRRLPRYRRYLNELRKQGVKKISSNELSELIGYTASQIRQDLNTFGGFGQQGYGYTVDSLFNEINRILGLDREYKTIVVGIGNLGQAITNYTYYYKIGFNIVGLFDVNPKLVGLSINDVLVRDFSEMSDFVKENNIDIAIICVNRENAQKVTNVLVDAGIEGIWNFAPLDLDVPEHVAVENVHLSDSLHTLSFMIRSNELEESDK
ncbi:MULTISPECIES: redox-sensing transcriptional repressor Rex [Mogibacterium]|uniref:Redox-sensing transcriptional repressor Rex n=2 Tax=Mogibacterium timidum TaxID=35519 RepID=X8IS30_9FIRM|nr:MULTISPECIES: redox-sensing transcriptional repressor Rex [Mogibacterium]EJU20303.1 DNA-binding protein N-terminal domain protein [Mogibacterium sp. CM50]EUC52580.1 putative redox-sensing transcriptional repressor Rex [Mogibacterium timidum ATCC 33093]NWO23281.1 redox-sensing transcriptional repressor Rex [Mogibacterium timidum]